MFHWLRKSELSDQPRESKMLELVRKWRREVYEADQRGETLSSESLRREFGLDKQETRRKPAA